MIDYRVSAPVVIVADEIRLTDDQARRRSHMLEPGRSKGIFLPMGALNFKAGEVIGLKDVSKTNMAKLEVVGGEKSAEKSEPVKETAPGRKTSAKSK